MIGVWGRLKHAFCHSCLPTSIKNEDMISISLFTHKSLLLKPVELNFRKLTQWCKEQSTLVVYKFSKTGMWKHPELAKMSCIRRLVWRCSTKNCNRQASIYRNSWFSCSKLSTEKVIPLTYLAHSYTMTQVVQETSLDDGTTSTETVID